ncbi:MAG: hypothetical protein LBF75_00475 [Treponema sp.]|nr:hypothetical protein [Treponema sp.]
MKNISNYSNLEKTIDAYLSFISCEMNGKIWESIEYNDDVIKLNWELREESISCLQYFEKYKAMELQETKHNISNYFKNMEICIEAELVFRPLHIDITICVRYSSVHENRNTSSYYRGRTVHNETNSGFRETSLKCCYPVVGDNKPGRGEALGKHIRISWYQPFIGYPLYKTV